MVFDAYDGLGNLLQQRRMGDVATVYVWGYNSTRPVAEIKNATHSQVQAVLGVDPNGLTTEAQLRAALDRLRQQLPQALVTTYTYDPLVGITSQTDPSGHPVTYEYDALGRLLRAKDERGRILSQNDYHYPQP